MKEMTENNKTKWKLAQTKPTLAFLILTFAWTWLFWLAAIPFRGEQNLLVTAIVMIGGFGPAVGGILALGLRKGFSFDLRGKKLATMVIGALVIFGIMALRYRAGNIEGYSVLAKDLTLTVPIVAASVFASLVGGWVISSAFSNNTDIRSHMASILPTNLPLGWTLLALVFFPGMILLGWLLASMLKMPVEFPALWNLPLMETLPLYLLTFALTFFAQGGNEEPGWRGMMQPALQKKFSPLAAALIVSFSWSLWHLPLFLNGFYPEGILFGMLSGGIYRILLAIFLAWFYNRSGGNVFLMIYLHTCFNVMVRFLPVSNGALLVLWIIVVAFVILKDKMYHKLAVDRQE